MKEAFERMLKKVIIPHFKTLVDVKVYSYLSHKNWFHVEFYFLPTMTYEEMADIIEETNTLYQMFGVIDGEINIRFYKQKKGI